MPSDPLDHLPFGWGKKAIRFIFRIHNGATPQSGESDYWNGDINWLTPEDLGENDQKSISESKRKITEAGYSSCAVSLAPAGSIAVSTRAPIGHIAKTTLPSCVNQGCRLLEPREGDSDFWYYACVAARETLISLGQGTTFMELPRQRLAAVKLPVPPTETQREIAAFLDLKTGQIDELITRKRALLGKISEKRRALISYAMTSGLDSQAEHRTTQTDWLNSIPRHWEVKKLKYVSHSMQTGPFGSQLHSGEYIDDGIPVINPADIQDGELIANPKNTVDESVAERLSRHRLIEGDIIIGRRGEMGRAGLVHAENIGWLCGTGSLRARLNKEIVMPEFVLYQFSLAGVVDFLSLQSVGSTMDNLNTTILGNIPIAVPPLSEQQEVLNYLGSACMKLDTQRSEVSQVIITLTEYRSSLISHAVTGQIDVSSAPIPDGPHPSDRVLEA